MQFVKPLPFDEAVDKLGSKTLIGSKLSSSEWSDVPPALRERAFFSSQVESLRFLQRGRDSIVDFQQANVDANGALKTGSRADFVKQMQDFLRSEGVERTDGGIKDLAGERRLGLIFDTNTRAANDYGYWREGQDTDVLDAFPAQRFIRVLDVKEPRTEHTQYEGLVALKSDPVWLRINEDFGVPWGPWGWGCGHDVEDVSREEAESLGLLSPATVVAPDTRHFNENLKASTRGLDPDLLAKLRTELGDQLVIDGEQMLWRGEARQQPRPTSAPSGGASVPASRPATEPAAPASDPAPTKPVSQAVQVQVRGPLKRHVDTGFKAIDKVHDDGVLPPVPVVATRGNVRHLGAMVSRKVGGQWQTQKIEVRSSGSWPALTTVHEAGHFIDVHGMGGSRGFATESSHAISKVIEVARQSEAIKGLEKLRDNAGSMTELKHWRYHLKPHEIWARAYAQFIAEESGDPVLRADLERVHQAQEHRQWKTKDFAPIAAEIRKQFKALGWIK